MNFREITETTRWAITINKPSFEKLKSDESFWAIVALSRAVNATLYMHGASAAYVNDDSPAAKRAQYNAILFSCAILYECYLSVQGMGKYFRDLPQFKKVSALLNTKESRKILDSTISELRNQVVFHVSPSAMGKQLATMDLERPVFLSAMGRTNEQMYYELADICAFEMLHGSLPTALPNDLDFAEKVSNLIIDFSNLAQDLILEVLTTQGWRIEVQTR
jgi:hypothetical protein